MSQTGIRWKTIAFAAGVSFIVVWTAGCGPSQEVRSLREQNQALARRVTELEDQVKQADADVSAATTAVPPAPATESVYIVVEGDNLWGIAKNKLGSGTRYKEILALNPHVTKDQPLAIGTQLKLPPR